MEHVDVSGLRIAFRHVGSGPPLLLLHGAACDSRVWRRAAEGLGADFTVIAWDAPGCGESSDAPDDFRMSDFADSLAGLIDALGAVQPHVLGHSWGSTLALELARKRPEGVRSLILVGAYAGWAGSLPVDETSRRLGFALAAADAVESGSWDPRTMPGLFSSAMPPERADELASIMADIRPAGTRTMAHALADADLSNALGAITAPTLLLQGDADERSPLSVGRALHEALPRSTLQVLPGLGHECFLEDPSAFEAATRGWLRGLGE